MNASFPILVSMLLLASALDARAEEFDACALLTSDEIEAVQGQPVADAKGSSRTSGGYLFAQCFFTLPTYESSISLHVTLPDGDGESPASPEARWREVFDAEGRTEKKDRVPPEPIPGLGDEAFWASDAVVGILYVRAGDLFFRISLGGVEDPAERLAKSSELARRALTRLPAS